MSAPAIAPPVVVPAPRAQLRVGAQTFAVVWPRLSDPRLWVASILLTVQVLGQTVIGWNLSVAQLLVTLGTAAVVEFTWVAARHRRLAWPASALLTGNGIALLLRVPGTTHGDWWSLNGWYVYVAAVLVALGTKYAIRYRGRHVFNPSNVALVVTFVVLGSAVADPQDLWWGPMSWGLVATWLLIVVGGVVVTSRIGVVWTALGFWLPFAGIVSLLGASGHCFSARWSPVPVCGTDYVSSLVFSPEVMIFAFFMVTDPPTTLPGRVGRFVQGLSVAAVSGVLVAAATTEFAAKVSLLAGLVVVCALRPLLARWVPAAGSPADSLRAAGSTAGLRWSTALVVPVVALVTSAVTLSSFSVLPVADPQRGARPQLEVPGPAPVVAVDVAAASEFGVQLSDATATAAVADLRLALAAWDEALVTADVSVAAPMLAAPAAAVLAGDVAEGVEPAPLEMEVATVGVSRSAANPQATPEVSVLVEGTRAGEEFSGSFPMVPSGDRWLLLRPPVSSPR